MDEDIPRWSFETIDVEVSPIPQASRRKSLIAVLKKHKVTLLLLLFVGFSAGSVVLFPRRPAITRPAPTEDYVVSTDSVAQETLRVVSIDSNTFHISGSISPEFDIPYAEDITNVALQVPDGAKVTRFECKTCFPPYTSPPFSDNPNLEKEHAPGVGLSLAFSMEVPIRYFNSIHPPELTYSFDLHTSEYIWSANGSDVEANLPTFLINPQPPVPRDQSTPSSTDQNQPMIDFSFAFPGASSYDWNQGPEPSVGSALGLSQPGVSWVVPPSSTVSDYVEVGGTDSGAQDEDTIRIFLAGAFVGIAGGALIGALQEWLHGPDDEESGSQKLGKERQGV